MIKSVEIQKENTEKHQRKKKRFLEEALVNDQGNMSKETNLSINNSVEYCNNKDPNISFNCNSPNPLNQTQLDSKDATWTISSKKNNSNQKKGSSIKKDKTGKAKSSLHKSLNAGRNHVGDLLTKSYLSNKKRHQNQQNRTLKEIVNY